MTLNDPERVVAELIAGLPDDFGDLTAEKTREMAQLHGQLAEGSGDVVLGIKAWMDRLGGATPPTSAELAEFETKVARRALAIERAEEALAGWMRSAGASRYGLPADLWQPREPRWIEQPDGTLEVRIDRPTFTLEGAEHQSCVACSRRDVDTAIVLIGEAEFIGGQTSKLAGVSPEDAWRMMLAFSADMGCPPGEVPAGHLQCTVRLCSECAAKTGAKVVPVRDIDSDKRLLVYEQPDDDPEER